MDDDLAFCLRCFADEQRIELETTRIKQEERYHAIMAENEEAEKERQRLQNELIANAKGIFDNLQLSFDRCYNAIRQNIIDFFDLTLSTLNMDPINRLAILLMTWPSESSSTKDWQEPPSYVKSIFREAVVIIMQHQHDFAQASSQKKEDDQSDVSGARLESIMKSISQNQTICDANRRYSNDIREHKKKVYDQGNSLQDDQSETSRTIFTILSKTIDDVYNYHEEYISMHTWNGGEQFWTDIVYKDFVRSISSYDEQKREENEKKRRQLEQRHRADQGRVCRDMLQLANTMHILAVGASETHQETFKERLFLEQKCDEDRNKSVIVARSIAPVIFGRIDDMSTQPLPLTVTLDENFENWEESKTGARKRAVYITEICRQLKIPQDAFKIERIEAGSTRVYGIVQPPYGKVVLDYFSVDDAELKNLSESGRITTITLGRFGLDVNDQVLFPHWNRVYSSEPGGTYWTGSLDRAGKPYYCPIGWTRFAIKVTETQKEFDQRYNNYHIAYHGTRHALASDILNKGLLGSKGCYRPGLNIYLSPSIEYSAHPRYAKVWNNDSKGKYYQMVFQCRVNPRLVRADLIKPETLLAQNAKHMQIDPNFSNKELEWVLPADEPVSRDDLICYGIMLRVTNGDPAKLSTSEWWTHVWWNES